MGRFFSNIQINMEQKNQEQFVKLFCKAMEQHGLMPATEDDSSQTYLLAFSKNNKWVTLCSAGYEAGGESVKKDVSFFAEALKTCCISTTVLDSDFAVLEMYNGISTLTDMVIVGHGDDYGFPDGSECRGNQEYWEQYLIDGSTWEQLSEIWAGDYVFTEEALAEIAPLLGMDLHNIISDYDDLSSRTDENIVTMYFKKKGKKALSLDAAFKQVFAEGLEPLGFKKIKGKQPYFVRVVPGGEIIHVITCMNEGIDSYGFRKFNILGGVATVYRQSIDLLQNPSHNINWMAGNLTFYKKTHNLTQEEYRAVFDDLYEFFCEDDTESLTRKMEYVLKATRKIMLPMLNSVTDLEACIEYFEKFQLPMHLYNDGSYGSKNSSSYYNEGYLYIKTNNQDGIRKKWRQGLIQ